MATAPTKPVPAPTPVSGAVAPIDPTKKPGESGAAGDTIGTFQAPPAHAPIETSQPLDAETIAAQVAKAHANELELAPLKYALDKAVASAAGATSGGIVLTATPHAAPDAPAGSAHLQGQPPLNSHPPIQPQDALPGPNLPPAPAPAPDPLAGIAPIQPHQKAASNTDSPSRGVPQPLPLGKQITGGWGSDGGFEPQYYALDGTELLALVRAIWAQLNDQLDLDLRFGIASCYPQVAARVTIEISGAHAGASVNQVAFTRETQIAMLTAQKVDDQVTPADALRVEAGVERPYKRTLRTATGTFIVDREVNLGAGAPLDPPAGT